MQPVTCWMIGLMFLGVIAIFFERWWTGKGLGARTVQLLSILLIIPGLIILAAEGKASAESIMALLGTIIGFTLSGLAVFDFRKNGRTTRMGKKQ